MNKLLTTILSLILFISAHSQDFSNRGKEFWVGYGYHQGMSNGNSQEMVLYFTSDVLANVTVDIPGIGWTRTYVVAANSVKESDFMPKAGTQNATLTSEGISNKGIHITSDQPIVAYAHILNQSVSGATLLFPVNTLGQDYYSLNFTQKSNTSNSNSWAFVVATEDNTTVEITPSEATLTHAAGVAFNVTLNKGQIFNLMGTVNNNTGVDLTGTRFRSISSGANSCKKIAVFSGAGRMSIYCSGNNATTSDNLIQQVFPKVAWGKKFLTVPTVGLSNNIFRIAVSDTSTKVAVDGVKISGLIKGFYYEIAANVPKSIITDKPVMVAQYITSTNNGNNSTCSNTYSQKGDPEMIYISPIEQTIDTITLFSTPRYNITEHHINIVIKNKDINSFTLDGVGQAGQFTAHPQDPTYSYAKLTVNSGQHKLAAAGGFNAIAYGYGQFESYGYNAGTNIKDLYTFISLQNQFDIVNSPVTCINTNFLFSITLPYQPSSITWDFSGATSSLTPNATVVSLSPVADSSFIRDGKTLYVYKIPGSYKFTSGGIFPIKIVTVNPTADGCSGQNEVIFNVNVSAAPTADYTISHNGCFNTPTQFTDSSKGNGNQITKWKWDFGDSGIDSVQNPVHIYAASGSYLTKLIAINNIGCSDTKSKPFIIEPQPLAKFGISAPACVGSTISFSDSSTIPSGTIVKWRWAFGPGDSIINNTNAPVTRIYNTAGSYTVTLVVENSSGCKSIVFSRTFTINALPFVNFSMPGVCLPAGNAQFSNLSTIAGGTVNDMTYNWSFGDGGTSTAINPSHTYTTAGPFNVKLTATTIQGCVNDSTIRFTNIYNQPKAGFTYNPQITCTKDSITFLDTTKTPGSTVNQWFWTFSDGTSSNLRNPGKRFTLDTVIVKLSIQSAAGCSSDTATKTIIFNKLPKALFNITGTTCQGQTFTLNDQSIANSGIITNWYWYFGNGTSASLTNSNPINKKFDTIGTYIIKLIVKTDKGCKSDTARQTVNVIPAPTVKFGMPFVCEKDPVAIFTDSSSVVGGGVLSYLWNFNDPNATISNPNTSTLKNGQHQYTTAGTYNVSLQVGTATGCSSSLTKTFTVNSQPFADFVVLNSGGICGNDSVKIKNNSTISVGSITKIEIIWDSINNPLVNSTYTSPNAGGIYFHKYPAKSTDATYKIVVRVYSGQTCMSEKVLSILVGVTPKVRFGPVNDICLNDPPRKINEASETLGISGIPNYSGNGIAPDGLFNPLLTGPGQISITYSYVSNNGCKDSASQNIVVVANPNIKLPSLQYVLEGGLLTLSPEIKGSPTKFTWSPSTYLNNPNAATTTVKPQANISYLFVASTSGGCSDSAKINIVVLNAPKIPNAFSPNGDGKNDYWEIASLSSYPGCTVDVFNRYGQNVFTSSGYSKPWDGTYKGAVLPAGVYYYIINPKNGRSPFTGSLTILR